MKRLAQTLSVLALLATLISPFLFVQGQLDLPATQRWLIISTLCWFLTAPWWLGRKQGG
jgi:hypothetical protein